MGNMNGLNGRNFEGAIDMNEKVVNVLSQMADVLVELEKKTREKKWEDHVDTPIQKQIRETKFAIKEMERELKIQNKPFVMECPCGNTVLKDGFTPCYKDGTKRIVIKLRIPRYSSDANYQLCNSCKNVMIFPRKK